MTIGFIGLGNMGLAMFEGIRAKRDNKPIYTVKSRSSSERLEGLLGQKARSLEEVKRADIIFLAVKPKDYPKILEELSRSFSQGQILVTMAPGFSLEKSQSFFDRKVKILRSMPATPAQVGMSVSGLSFNENFSEEEKALLIEIFESFGWVHLLEERDMEAFSSLCGVMPAFLMKLIEGMADQAVAWGLARDKAYKMAAQIMMGSSSMLLEKGLHPGQLKDQVTSPGGTTIEGILALEEWGGVRALQKAMEASYKKGRAMEEALKD